MKIIYASFLFFFLIVSAPIALCSDGVTSRTLFERQCAADRITSPSLAYGMRLTRWRATGDNGATPDLDALSERCAMQERIAKRKYQSLAGLLSAKLPPTAKDVDNSTDRTIRSGFNRSYRRQDYERALNLMKYSRKLFDEERDRWAPLVQR